MPIRKISIASEYDGSLGYVLHGEPEHRYVEDERRLRAQIVCLMGGRAAEKIVFERTASGGANDLEKATLIATRPGRELRDGRRGGTAHGAAPARARGQDGRRHVTRAVGSGRAQGGGAVARGGGAEATLRENRAELDRLRAELMEKKTIELVRG